MNLTPLFSTQGAVGDAIRAVEGHVTRMQNREAAADALVGCGWSPLVLAPEYRTGILLARAERHAVKNGSPDALRAALRDRDVAATTYPGGLVRLSMPGTAWRPEELDHLRRSLTALA